MASSAVISKTVARAAIAIPLAGALALAAPLAASAHVHVAPERASAGDYATLQFKVPTESASASTVKLEVDFPADHPFTSVSYQPVAGWKVDVVQATLPAPVKTDDGTITKGVTRVVWTAGPGAGVAPGAFQLFTVSAGAVPDTGRVELPAIQTYSDGSVVKWDQATPASGDEPEHPAPVLYINDAPPADAAQGIVAQASAAPAASSGGTSSAASPVALGLAIGGLGLGVIALFVAIMAFVRGGSVRPRDGARAVRSAAPTDTVEE